LKILNIKTLTDLTKDELITELKNRQALLEKYAKKNEELEILLEMSNDLQK